MNELPPAIPMQKPKSLVVFGILNLLLAAMGIMGVVSSLLILFIPSLHANNPVLGLMESNTTYATYYKIIIVPGILALAALTASAIGLFKGKEWARKLTLWWAAYSVVALLVNTWMTYEYVNPYMLRTLDQTGSTDATTAQVTSIILQVTTIAGVVLHLAYAVVLFVMLSRAKVKAYCRNAKA